MMFWGWVSLRSSDRDSDSKGDGKEKGRIRVVRRGASVYTAVTVKVTVIVLKGTNKYMYMHTCAYICVWVRQ